MGANFFLRSRKALVESASRSQEGLVALRVQGVMMSHQGGGGLTHRPDGGLTAEKCQHKTRGSSHIDVCKVKVTKKNGFRYRKYNAY